MLLVLLRADQIVQLLSCVDIALRPVLIGSESGARRHTACQALATVLAKVVAKMTALAVPAASVALAAKLVDDYDEQAHNERDHDDEADLLRLALIFLPVDADARRARQL